MRIIFIVIALSSIAFAQPERFQPEDSLFLGMNKHTLITYGTVSYSVLSFYIEYRWWWEGNYHPFRYETDGFWHNYSLGVDKVGHFYTSYLYFHLTYELIKWGQFDDETALWLAIAFPAINALSIEIGDGFSTFSFSSSDLIANSLGIGYSVLQKKYPFFENINFKWSYYPSGVIPMDDKFRITDDYDGHYYWLSVNPYPFLPSSVKEYYPRWLSLAVGYGARNISGRPSFIGPPISSKGIPKRTWAVSLDYNLLEIPLENGLWTPVKQLLNCFKLPAPGIKSNSGERPEYRIFLSR